MASLASQSGDMGFSVPLNMRRRLAFRCVFPSLIIHVLSPIPVPGPRIQLVLHPSYTLHQTAGWVTFVLTDINVSDQPSSKSASATLVLRRFR